MASGRTRSILCDGLLVALFAFFMFPIYWVDTMSFKSDADILVWPPKFVFGPTLSHYKAILMNIVTKGTGLSTTVDFPSYFLNSLVVCLLAVAISLLVGIPAAYAFARFRFRGSDSLAFNFLTFRFAPEMLVIIPIYIFYTWSGLYNTYLGLVWVYQLITLPMVIWILRGYFEDVPVDLEQAGRLDGYSRW